MGEKTRNVAVGVTVLVALALLAAMILIFTGLPQWFAGGYEITMRFPSSGDIHEGDSVHLLGMRVGKVTDVHFMGQDPRRGVSITARINRDVSLPGNVQAVIGKQQFMGTSYLELRSQGPYRVDEKTGQVMEYLPHDYDKVIEGQIEGAGLIPPEMRQAFANLSELAANLNKFLAEPTAVAPPATGPAATAPATQPQTLRGTLARLDATLASINAVMGDVENQSNIKASLASLAVTSARAAEAMDALKLFAAQAQVSAESFSNLSADAQQRIDRLTDKLIADAESISDLMSTLNLIAIKIDSGEGTAAKMLNDPQLYNNLLSATRQLTELAKDMRQLMDQWEKSGVGVKLK